MNKTIISKDEMEEYSLEKKYEEIISELKRYANKKNVEGMARFGIVGKNVIGGPSLPVLRKIAKVIGRNHEIAQKLWQSEIHEARILASMVDDPVLVTKEQMEEWVSDFDSWDVCDQVCANLFDKTDYAISKVSSWVKREEEFVKRAGFVLIATLSVHNKKMIDGEFLPFFSLIVEGSTDERNFVKKAVNWALRQIGKRNLNLNALALKTASEIKKLNSKSAKWIASDAIRELENEKIKLRIKK